MDDIYHTTKTKATLVPEFSAPTQPELELALNTLAKGINTLYKSQPVPQESGTLRLTKANDGINFSYETLPDEDEEFVGRFQLYYSSWDQKLYVNSGSVAFINAACEIGSPGEISEHTNAQAELRLQANRMYPIDKDGCPVWGNDIEPVFPMIVKSAADGEDVDVDDDGAGWEIGPVITDQGVKELKVWVKAWTSRNDEEGNELTGGTDNINQIKAGKNFAQLWLIDASKDPAEVADTGSNEVGYGCQFFLVGKVVFKDTEGDDEGTKPYTLESIAQYWMSDVTIVKYRVEKEVGSDSGIT